MSAKPCTAAPSRAMTVARAFLAWLVGDTHLTQRDDAICCNGACLQGDSCPMVRAAVPSEAAEREDKSLAWRDVALKLLGWAWMAVGFGCIVAVLMIVTNGVAP